MELKLVTIQEAGFNLSGTIVVPSDISNRIPAVIFYHGMPSQSKPRYVKRAVAMAKEGIVGLCFDFRGCGESDGQLGKMSLKLWLEDALLAYDFLVQQSFVDKNRVGISGKSFGGYMGALVSEKRDVKSMVLQAPAVYPDAWFDKLYATNDEVAQKRLTYRNSTDALNNKAIDAIKKYTNPLLVIASELDDICPRPVVEGYFNSVDSTQKEIRWIKDADHALHNEEHNQEYTEMMVDWFKKTL